MIEKQYDSKVGFQSKPGFWSYLRDKELDFFPSTGLRWWLLCVVMFAWTIEQFERAKISPVLVYVLKDFNVNLSTWGVIAAIGSVVGALGAFVFSYLADNIGRRPVIIYPISAYVFIALGTALAPNFSTLAGLYILGYITVTGMLPPVQAAIRDISPRMGRAISYSVLSLAFVLGALLSTWAGAIFIPIWPGWRPQFWIAAVVALVTFLFLAIFYKDLTERVRSNIIESKLDQQKFLTSRYSDIKAARKSGNLVYKDWRMWVVSTACVFWAVTYMTIVGYVPLYFTQYFSIEPAKAASLTSVFWIVAIFSIFFGGWVSDKLQVRKTVTIFGGIATGVCFVIMSVLPANTSIASLVIIWCIEAVFAGFIYPPWCALISEMAENISPFGVARAFGIMGILNVFAGVFLNLGLPAVVGSWGWPAWMLISGICCFLIATTTGFGRGPWLPPKFPVKKGTSQGHAADGH
jgi:OPA family glycerol-3-phosphate transporter-like MFS transporter